MGEEYYLQHPRNQQFYYMLSLIINVACLGDRRLLGYDKATKLFFINSSIMFFFAPVCLASQLMYFYVNYDDLTFDILGIIFSIFPATCVAYVNLLSARLKSYKRLMGKLFENIHLYTVYIENKDEFVRNRLLATERYTRWTTYYLTFFFGLNWIGWIGITAMNNYNNRELVRNHTARLQTCVFLWLPIDYSYNFKYWYFIHFANTYVVATGVLAIAVYQSLNNIFVYNIIGHIQILKNIIETSFIEELTNEEAKDRLANIIKYQSFIKSVFQDMQHAFGFNVIANYMQNLLGNSIVLYQLMYGGKENMILYIAMIMAYTGGPILMSFVLEEVKKQTDDLPDVLYGTPWEDMSVSNQKTVLIMLQKSQAAFEFEALGILIAGVKPMVSILKTTFSYYVMLKTTMKS